MAGGGDDDDVLMKILLCESGCIGIDVGDSVQWGDRSSRLEIGDRF